MSNQMEEQFEKYMENIGDVKPEDKIGPDERRVKGKIIKVDERGWGFISSREIEFTRIFFHWTLLRQDTLKFKELKRGMEVEFTPVELEGRGWRAMKIKVLTKP